ncbi:hypothetical protein V2G26_021182 [Clonostachys chloroleuca]
MRLEPALSALNAKGTLGVDKFHSYTHLYSPKMSTNPAPIAMCGIFIAIGPLALELLCSTGASQNVPRGTQLHMWFGGILILLGGILEQISGDSLASLAFISLSAFCFLSDVTSLENKVMSDGDVGLSSINQSVLLPLFLEIAVLTLMVSAGRKNIALTIVLVFISIGVLMLNFQLDVEHVLVS